MTNTAKKNKADLFGLILDRVKDVSSTTGLKEPQAFGRWFANMYFHEPQGFYDADGSRDGKIDLFFNTNDGKVVKTQIPSTKYTEGYNKTCACRFLS